jgi:cullin 4
VLKKVPPGKDVEDDDEFVYNADFTDPTRRIHINSIQQKETVCPLQLSFLGILIANAPIKVEESKATDDKIQEDRGYLLDAAIVRIMKGRKRLTNQMLITETVVAVKGHFQPDVRQIKKQLDSLTDREYIRRDDDNKDVYHYVA